MTLVMTRLGCLDTGDLDFGEIRKEIVGNTVVGTRRVWVTMKYGCFRSRLHRGPEARRHGEGGLTMMVHLDFDHDSMWGSYSLGSTGVLL